MLDVCNIDSLDDALESRTNVIHALRWFMKVKHITIEDVSKRSGLHYQTIVNLFKENRKGTKKTWEELLKAIDLGYVETKMIELPQIQQRLNDDLQNHSSDTIVSVYCREYASFVYCCDYEIGQKKDGFTIQVSLEDAQKLFSNQKPIQ